MMEIWLLCCIFVRTKKKNLRHVTLESRSSSFRPWSCSYFSQRDIGRMQKSRSGCVCCGHGASSAFTPPLSSLPPSLTAHATQVAGGLCLSLTAANYRLTRPCCALHDCLTAHSGYPKPGRSRESWRERWLRRRKGERQREKLKQKGWMVREKKQKKKNLREINWGGGGNSGLERTD